MLLEYYLAFSRVLTAYDWRFVQAKIIGSQMMEFLSLLFQTLAIHHLFSNNNFISRIAVSLFVNLRTSEVILFSIFLFFYWHFVEILWIFIFLIFYKLFLFSLSFSFYSYLLLIFSWEFYNRFPIFVTLFSLFVWLFVIDPAVKSLELEKERAYDWMQRLSRSLIRFETQDIKTQPLFNHFLSF